MKFLRPSARLLILSAILVALLLAIGPFRRPVRNVVMIAKGQKTVAQRVAEFSPAVHGRLDGEFARIGVAYPPKKITLAAFKEEMRMEAWVAGADGRYRLLKTYPILGASGHAGPKLRKGDSQVPEGIYRIESLNPNSLYHLALRLNYPNAQDKAQARRDGRYDLGGDIMIHGKSSSIGCLAMGDAAAEELFVLASETGIKSITVLICPWDFRTASRPVAPLPGTPGWVTQLYADLKNSLTF